MTAVSLKRFMLLAGIVLLLLAGCAPAGRAVQTLAAALPPGVSSGQGPLGGAVEPLPTPDPRAAATATPAPSRISFPTAAPPPSGPLATMTALAGLLPTQDLWATPYTIALRGLPHFIEFQAWW